MRVCLYLFIALAVTACGAPEPPADTLQLDRFRGRWVVVNYWAVWCKPCIQEIPELNALAEQYPQVSVLGVNYDGITGEELAAQIARLDIAFPVLPEDPAPRLGIPRPAVLPTTLVLDPGGQLRATLVGPQTLESLTRATQQ